MFDRDTLLALGRDEASFRCVKLEGLVEVEISLEDFLKAFTAGDTVTDQTGTPVKTKTGPLLPPSILKRIWDQALTNGHAPHPAMKDMIVWENSLYAVMITDTGNMQIDPCSDVSNSGQKRGHDPVCMKLLSGRLVLWNRGITEQELEQGLNEKS